MTVLVQAIIFVVASAMAVQSVFYLQEPFIRSPGILPLLVALAMAVLAAGLLIGEIRNGAVSLSAARRYFAVPDNRAKALRTAGWLSLSTLYAVATPQIGFAWATLAFLVVALAVFAKLAWWKVLILAVAIATIVPVIFRYVFFAIVP